MLTTLAALLLSIAGLIIYDLRQFYRGMVNDLTAQSEVIGRMSVSALETDDAHAAHEQLSLLRLRQAMRAGAIYGNNGRLLASYVEPDARGAPLQAPPHDGVVFAGDELSLVAPIIDGQQRAGTIYLRAAFAFWPRLLDYLAIGGAIMAGAMVTAHWLMRRHGMAITAPITALTGLMRHVVRTRDFSRRATTAASGEVAELIEAFNAMLSEIETRSRELEEASRHAASEVEQRRAAQDEVMRLNGELEARVRERTAQLESMNAELGKAMEAASQASQAKTAFLSSMSHELRTPLNAILGFAQILTSDTLPTNLEQKREFAMHILKSGRHLLTLINEILDMAKIESGAYALSVEPVALGEVLRECQAMIEPLADKRHIRVLFPDKVPDQVLADRTRLKQVLLNLLTNAIKYNRDEGAVVLDVTSGSGERARIAVQDTGVGLNEYQLAHLFEPFNRLGQESGGEEGTGIGLVVTRRLVELMGGAIGATSRAGVGSVFWIELTRSGMLASETVLPPPLLAPTHDHAGCRQTVLYVEDNPANLKLVQEVLRYRPGLCLLAAPDAHLGLELARTHRPDLILMDLNLPGLSGQDALYELRRDPATSAIPVVALTANAMPREIERGIAAGFARYLTKPLNLAEFTATVDALLVQEGEAS